MFSVVPLHIGIMVAALLCSNHVTYRFGKGMMPKAYRLSLNSMAVIMDSYAQQLAEQYGTDLASDVLARSRVNFPVNFAGTSQTNLVDTMPVCFIAHLTLFLHCDESTHRQCLIIIATRIPVPMSMAARPLGQG